MNESALILTHFNNFSSNSVQIIDDQAFDIKSLFQDIVKNGLQTNFVIQTSNTKALFQRIKSSVTFIKAAGIPQGVLVAQDLGVPFTYVRSSAKGHGRQNLIEGEIVSGQRVVVIEDLISTGQSSLKAVEALREAGCNVVGLVSIFTYQLPIAEENFTKAKCRLISLSNYDALIKYALENQFINQSEFSTLEDWRLDPEAWSKNQEQVI